jgi:two-component system response regulator RegX3
MMRPVPARAERPLRVLVASDDDAARQTLARMLRRDGCEVIEARDGTEVLEMLCEAQATFAAPPDVIMADLVMPTCSGLFVLTAVRRAGLRAKVLLLSGRCHASIRDYAQNLGAQVVPTPTEQSTLRAALARLFLRHEHKVGRALVA